MAKKRIDQRVEGRRRGLFSPPSGTTLGKGDTEMTVVRPRMRLCLLVVLAAAIAQPAAAAICNVPSAPHPNIQATVDDVGCTEIIIAAGLANGRHDGIKILGVGTIDRKLSVTAHAFSAAARTKIEAAGGTCNEV